MFNNNMVPANVSANDRQTQNVMSAASGTTEHAMRRQGGRTSNDRDLSGNSQPKKLSQIVSDKPGPRRMGFKTLEQLLPKDPSDIVFTLKNPKSGFSTLLYDKEIQPDVMALLLEALGKASQSNQTANLQALITSVVTCEQFIHIKLLRYLALVCTDYHAASLTGLVAFLRKYQVLFPASASHTITLLLPHLKETLNRLASQELLPDFGILDSLLHLEEDMGEYFYTHIQYEDDDRARAPPSDFRMIPVLPDLDDIHSQQRPVLRPNEVRGIYNSVDHYLDVQFHLLREDFMLPLRKGIRQYLQLRGQDGKHLDSTEIHIYDNVHLHHSVCTWEGVVHILSFDVTPLGHIQWEASKRLMYGSLLCLSCDNFQTILLATVAKQKLELHKKGIVEVCFESWEESLAALDNTKIYTMVETQAYFEAYRHNLAALQAITENTLPFKRYIIDIHTDVNPPSYLNGDTTYNLSVLWKAPDDLHNQNVAILNPTNWPSESDLGLDSSQQLALRMALTKEFVLIQGPPGTGKTFIGLKIVEVLLANASVWNSEGRPILVVCYTNHALDQFLEGILPMTSEIVRVGRQCVSMLVKEKQLSTLRKKMQLERRLERDISQNRRLVVSSMTGIQLRVDALNTVIKKAREAILLEEELKEEIGSVHLSSLKNNQLVEDAEKDNVILHWLGLRFTDTNPTAIQVRQSLLEKTDPKDLGNSIKSGTIRGSIHRQPPLQIQEDSEERAKSANKSDYPSDLVGMLGNVYIRDQKTDHENGKREGESLHKYVMQQLQCGVAMSVQEMTAVTDVWELDLEDRWRLYQFWISQHVKKCKEEILSLQKQFTADMLEYKEIQTMENFATIRHAKVVGMTTTGAAKYRSLIQAVQPRIVIVEEAAEVLEAHVVTSLASQTEHLILIGDHQQLRPSPTVYELARHYNLDISLFERMIRNGVSCRRLEVQHRMRPCISALLVPHFYPVLTNHKSVTQFADIRGVSKNMFFISHDIQENKLFGSTSRANAHEASFLAELCRYLLFQGYETSRITVLTTYTGQMLALKAAMRETVYNGVRITVVDNFQGEENDIILISFVRSNEEGSVGFLKVSNRVCVALSRAKMGLYCIGNFNLLAKESSLWAGIVKTLYQYQAIGQSLQLICENHHETSTFVSSATDFQNVPEGGCSLKCNYRLRCGHDCSLACHPYDPEHGGIECRTPCIGHVCPFGHQCMGRCGRACGPCTVLVRKVISKCGHQVVMPCHQNPEDFVCPNTFTKHLPCGHQTQIPCGGSSPGPCMESVTVFSPCGHSVTLECHRSNNESLVLNACRQPCSYLLDCQHPCCGTCVLCRQQQRHFCGLFECIGNLPY